MKIYIAIIITTPSRSSIDRFPFSTGSWIAPLKLVSETNEREEYQDYVQARIPNTMTGPIVFRDAFIFLAKQIHEIPRKEKEIKKA